MAVTQKVYVLLNGNMGWIEIGNAEVRSDGSMRVSLDDTPCSGELIISDTEPDINGDCTLPEPYDPSDVALECFMQGLAKGSGRPYDAAELASQAAQEFGLFLDDDYTISPRVLELGEKVAERYR